jgi:ABC-2 type transport system permease protein
MSYGFEQLGTLLTMGKAGKALLALGIIEHYKSMSRGVIDTRDIVYFIALILIFLFMTKTRLESHKK